MERKLLERMVGGGVLIVALVILGPMILDGSGSGESTDGEDIPGQRGDELRTHTFRLNQPSAASTPPSAAPITNPASEPPPVAMSSAGAQPPQRPGSSSSPDEPVVQPEPAPAGRPVANAAVAKPAPARRAVDGRWLVQVGTFGQKDNADRLVTGLKERGFEAVVSTTARSDKTMYRVRVGPPGTRAAADDLAGRLAAAGHPGQVVPQ